MRGNRGFTLLETIVALVIFSSAIVALYALINGSLVSFGRGKAVAEQLFVVEQAVEILSQYNFQGEGEGDIQIKGFTVHWIAKRLGPLRQSQNFRGYRGVYEIGLYNVDLDVSDLSGKYPGYQFRAVGYKRVRGGGN